MGIGFPSLPLCKIAVERVMNGIGFLLFGSRPCPLTNAWSAGVGQDHPADIGKGLQKGHPSRLYSVPVRNRGNGEFRF